MLPQLIILSIASFASISSVDETINTPNKGSITAVFEVVDGDTLRFEGARYRLARIQAAESKTPQGKRLTVILSDLLNPAGEPAKEVTCIWNHKGYYRRPIVECTAMVGSSRVNLSDYMLEFEGVKLWH